MFPFTKFAFWRLLAAVLLLAGALLAGMFASRVAAAPRDDIIQVPGQTGSIHLASTDLVRVGRGWVYRMPLEVNALDPIVALQVDGQAISVPFAAQLALRPGVWLHEGKNEVTVRAVTDTRVHERVFTINVEPLDAAAIPAGNTVNEQRILIFRPVDRGADVLPTDELLEVGGGNTVLFDPKLGRRVRGGLMYEFVVEVSAFSPIRWIKIDGQVVSEPHRTWAQAKAPVVVDPEGTEVLVEAVTDLAKAEQRFTLALAVTPLPGTRIYVANPPGYVKPPPPAPPTGSTDTR